MNAVRHGQMHPVCLVRREDVKLLGHRPELSDETGSCKPNLFPAFVHYRVALDSVSSDH